MVLLLQPQSGLLSLASELQMSAWLVTSQSAPKDGFLLCKVSHHRPSNKLTSPIQPSLISIKKGSKKKPNKTNITDEKMHRAKPLHQRSYLRRIKGGHQNCRVGSMAQANQPQKGINPSAVDCRVTSSLHVGPAARRAHASVTAVDCRGSQSYPSASGVRPPPG